MNDSMTFMVFKNASMKNLPVRRSREFKARKGNFEKFWKTFLEWRYADFSYLYYWIHKKVWVLPLFEEYEWEYPLHFSRFFQIDNEEVWDIPLNLGRLYFRLCSLIWVRFKDGKGLDLFKGSPDPSHFIFEIIVGKSRIRQSTILNLNQFSIDFWLELAVHHSISESLHVGSDLFRHWIKK